MKSRNLIYLSGVALMLSSCMASDMTMNPDMNEELGPAITGTVKSENGLPIEHIMVTAEWEGDRHKDIVYTSSEGKFTIPIHEELIGTECSVSLTIEDIDGIENGGEFEKINDQIMLFEEDENYSSDSISLDYQMSRATHEENSPQS